MLDLKYDSDREGSFTKEGYEKLRCIIQKQDAESKEMQTFINESKMLDKPIRNSKKTLRETLTLRKSKNSRENLTPFAPPLTLLPPLLEDGRSSSLAPLSPMMAPPDNLSHT
ncbi:Gag protein [Colletotrichum asianum]